MSLYTPRDDLAPELLAHLYREALGKHQGAHEWHMNAEWHQECLALSDPGDRPLWVPGSTRMMPDYLLGFPVKVEDHAGIPRLELLKGVRSLW